MARRSSAEIAADLELGESQSKREFRERKEHCAKMGIDAEAVSDAIRVLAKKFNRGPLEILWTVADDDNASASARGAAAMAILPYLHGKPKEMKSGPKGLTSGVMLVPMAASMEDWMSQAGPSQAALKASVRE